MISLKPSWLHLFVILTQINGHLTSMVNSLSKFIPCYKVYQYNVFNGHFLF
jgi:hypothetical protein